MPSVVQIMDEARRQVALVHDGVEARVIDYEGRGFCWGFAVGGGEALGRFLFLLPAVYSYSEGVLMHFLFDSGLPGPGPLAGESDPAISCEMQQLGRWSLENQIELQEPAICNGHSA